MNKRRWRAWLGELQVRSCERISRALNRRGRDMNSQNRPCRYPPDGCAAIRIGRVVGCGANRGHPGQPAERDYWMLSCYRLDALYTRLPEGTDPADLLALRGSTALTEALAAAQPLAERLLDERLANLPPAQALIEAARVVAADRPATGSRAAAPSAFVSVFRWRRSATPCSHSSKSGTPTRAEPRNNPADHRRGQIPNINRRREPG
jgi:hypothetical protein